MVIAKTHKSIYYLEMISLQQIGTPKERKIFGGYRLEFKLGRFMEPMPAVFVVTGKDPSELSSVGTEIKEREILRDAMRREEDEHGYMCLYDRVQKIEKAWDDKKISVRRKILWF